jgi:asparagine synthase (glutamine-hydrolysing)
MDKIFGIYDGGKVILNNQELLEGRGGFLSVTFDGEIYNRQELVATLEKKDHKFKSGTDSEIVGCAYREWGEECVKKFNGAFSFCVYDKEKNILFIVRDPLGEKFLYYTNYNGRFIFSSKVDSIVETPKFHKEIDLRALNHFIASRNVPDELCIFKNVKKLLPGAVLRFDLKSGMLETRRYWELHISEPESGNEDELLEKLEVMLIDSLKLRMKGEKSLGAFLSGGVDSSLVVALMSRFSSRRLKTFSVGFNEDKYSELPHARLIANYFNTDHREIMVGPNFDDFLESVFLFDEPIGDPSIIPTFDGCKIAGQCVEAVMTGDGADSLFTGMRTHSQVIRNMKINKLIVPPFDMILKKLVELIPEEAKWRIFLENLSPIDFYSKRETVFDSTLRERLFQDWVLDELGNSLYEPDKQDLPAVNSLTGMLTYLELIDTANDSLPKMEKICRNFSISVRAPFLDTKLIEFAFTEVPGNMKIRGGVTKYLLKKLAAKFLPPEFPLNRKRGLNPPLAKWIRHEWDEHVRDILLGGEERFFKRSYIEKLLRLHSNHLLNQDRRIFSLLVFNIWESRYLSNGN